ncbi:hypothetical protein JMK10_21125 [Rhodovulum sulfidophilum]|uniref:hypothetical protein n=1 Tax=Rhodovulum sulfidophilum TaxID=35806 RepID=UPI0019213F70|nr:hypothetical protein [Rhodovulum sulfidophilum]MBL3576216.1 hypothetical protein [Rhodovulum sulfidophilum]MCE8433599.1 hypothetical protein [Rhodovulum sulfidophilum]MCF4119169.1 hypothetical protein [Rhodovulum sulfidophilum]
MNRIARLGGVAIRRAGGIVTGVLWPSALGDGTLFGAIALQLEEDQVRWVRDVSMATGVDNLSVGQELVDRLADWEQANPGAAPPKSLYDEVIAQAQSIAADGDAETEEDNQESTAAGVTAGNVRITATLEETLGECAALACPPPVDGYGGGAHGCTKKPGGDQLDSHHMPAASASPLPREMGPAIRMEPVDHRMTSSYGVGAVGPTGILAQNGQVLAAFNLDAAEVEARFPGKYTASIAQARTYAECLRNAGMIR